MNRFTRVMSTAAVLAVVSAANAEAQLPDALANWLQPLSNCRTLSCIINNLPTNPPPQWPSNWPWYPTSGTTGPITTTPEPVTIALLGTGLAGIGLAARRRRQNGLA